MTFTFCCFIDIFESGSLYVCDKNMTLMFLIAADHFKLDGTA